MKPLEGKLKEKLHNKVEEAINHYMEGRASVGDNLYLNDLVSFVKRNIPYV